MKNLNRQIPQFFHGGFSEPALFYPGESIRRKERFIWIEMPGEVVSEPSANLQVAWTFFIGDFSKKTGPAFSLSVGYVLLDPEVESLRG
ncbi:MAG TPA: hypothetical protein VG324_01500 [Blastocatellia bacterium]|nr:hypothetical protein [Blastocatellia bacterium]